MHIIKILYESKIKFIKINLFCKEATFVFSGLRTYTCNSQHFINEHKYLWIHKVKQLCAYINRRRNNKICMIDSIIGKYKHIIIMYYNIGHPYTAYIFN